MSWKSILAALTVFVGSSVAANEPINLLDQVTNSEINFISEPVVQEIPEYDFSVEYDERQLDCLARVMHHEARGEGRKGQLAVGYVVVNRVLDDRWPETICEVTLQPWQFSYFHLNKDVKNYDHFYSLAQEIVSDYNTSNDPSKGALYFHATYVNPRWSRVKQRATRIKQHIFYR